MTKHGHSYSKDLAQKREFSFMKRFLEKRLEMVTRLRSSLSITVFQKELVRAEEDVLKIYAKLLADCQNFPRSSKNYESLIELNAVFYIINAGVEIEKIVRDQGLSSLSHLIDTDSRKYVKWMLQLPHVDAVERFLTSVEMLRFYYQAFIKGPSKGVMGPDFRLPPAPAGPSSNIHQCYFNEECSKNALNSTQLLGPGTKAQQLLPLKDSQNLSLYCDLRRTFVLKGTYDQFLHNVPDKLHNFRWKKSKKVTRCCGCRSYLILGIKCCRCGVRLHDECVCKVTGLECIWWKTKSLRAHKDNSKYCKEEFISTFRNENSKEKPYINCGDTCVPRKKAPFKSFSLLGRAINKITRNTKKSGGPSNAVNSDGIQTKIDSSKTTITESNLTKENNSSVLESSVDLSTLLELLDDEILKSATFQELENKKHRNENGKVVVKRLDELEDVLPLQTRQLGGSLEQKVKPPLQAHKLRIKSSLLTEWAVYTENIVFGRPFRRSRFGVVQQANWHGQVSVMIMEENSSSNLNFWSIHRMVSNLRRTRHENLMLFMGLVVLESTYGIVISLDNGTPLYDMIHNTEGPFRDLSSIHFMTQINNALGYLHSKSILHNNLSTKTIFVEKRRVYLCDYGLVTVENQRRFIPLHPSKNSLLLSRHWVHTQAPEVLALLNPMKHGIEFEAYSQASDMYALGVVWHEMVLGTLPFVKDTLEASIFCICAGINCTIDLELIPQPLKEPLLSCLCRQVDGRMTCAKLQPILEKIEKGFKKKFSENLIIPSYNRRSSSHF